MKKNINIIFTIILIFIGIILTDTIQARIFKNSPLISWKESLEDIDSWVDRGILIDTYYCTKEKDIITVSYHSKNSKFTCPIDNVNEIDNKVDYLPEIKNPEGISMIIQKGTLTNKSATIIITDTTGKENIYGQEYRIDKYENNSWKVLDIVFEGNYGWNSIGYIVDDYNKLEFNIDWEWLYGKLKKGKYRIVKSTSMPLESANHYFSVEFEIE